MRPGIKRFLIFGMIICIFLVGGYFLLTANASEADVIPIREYSVSRGDITAGISANGYICLERVPVYFDYAIQLDEVYVQPGDPVEKKTRLAKLSPHSLENAQNKIKEDLQAAELKLSTAEIERELGEIETKQEQSEVYGKERQRKKKEGDLKLQALANNIALAKIEIDALKVQSSQIDALCEDPYIYAGMEGVIAEMNYTYGETIIPEKPVSVVGTQQDGLLCLPVTQSDIVAIEIGQTVELSFDAYPGVAFQGEAVKKQAFPKKDSNPALYNVFVSVNANDTPLLDGMTCSARFIQKQVKNVLFLSNKAIRSKDGVQYVLIKNGNGELMEHTIQTGFSDGRYSEITSGLSEGETIYVEGDS